jgi:hypothetical protein
LRIAKRTNVTMAKVCTWIPLTEYQAINKAKGDISASLFIRRAIKKALLAEEDSTHTPETANVVVSNVHTEDDVVKTTTTLASKREVEAV